MELASHRVEGRAIDPFTERAYELVEAWVAETGRGGVHDAAFVGDASAIILASDVLIERGTPSWDACGSEVVHRVRAMGFGCVARSFGDAVLAFRRWLAEKGHAGTEGIEELEACVRALVDEAVEPGKVVTVGGRLPVSHDDGPRNRHERRALAAYRRQRARPSRRAR